MKKLLFVLTIFTIGCSKPNAQSQTSNFHQDDRLDTGKVNEYISLFFKKYNEEGTSKAIDYIFSFNNLLANHDQLNNLKNKLDSTRNVIGKYCGQTLIVEKSASPDLILLTYLVKHEKEPIRFSFIFYKPNKQWILFKFQYDDEIISELEDSGKIYFIK